ncbi:interleukin-12 receptor subunit beta-2 [Parambassis ranga]|uniref:Interleukin-12 receptor subunit beta-2 n=1 Tax=Parambassis ranga TaxID=210632 RepID=A0A6P7I778_9TELE|nr:interleukin-12 receptor subunit beta-2-like [Parambassis ranga]
MATMFQSWSIHLAITLLAVQLCFGQKSCVIWSSAGHVVQRGSTFQVYCTFNCTCKGTLYSYHPPVAQAHKTLNPKTIYSNVVNITENRTYSCQCNCIPGGDPCGLDISAGYPPDRPKNISCIHKITYNDRGDVECTWNRGRHTYLWNSSVLWMRTVSGNHTDGPVHKVSSKGAESPTASFNVSRSVQFISVWVQAQNELGSVESSIINYTLSDIAMPPAPVLGQPQCSSRACILRVEQSVRTQHLQIQSRTEQQTWTASPVSAVQMTSPQTWSISSLEPYRLYYFRARTKFSSGLWSQWSTNTSSWTQEEAPTKELDVWSTAPASDLKSLRVYWKEPNNSISRGKIIQYTVSVKSPDLSVVITNMSADTRRHTVPFCDGCEVTVWARNSKGLSPPARITTQHSEAEPLDNVHVSADNSSITISWTKPESAPSPAAYVVEWYPVGHKLAELRWVKVGKDDNHTVISDVKPFECYEGAVYAFYNETSVSRTRFGGVAIWEAAPEVGPQVQEKAEGNKVKITWTDLPRDLRRGCITNYTIYLEKAKGHQEKFCRPASEREYVTKELPPGGYSLWMTASSARGEGRPSQKIKLFLEPEASIPLLAVGIIFFAIAVFLVCLCQSTAVKRRLWEFFQCLMLDVVPDPANSKWAKECAKEKDKMNLQLQLSNSTVTEEEEEPILVDVEELPGQNTASSKPTNVSSLLLHPQTCLSPDTQPATPLYPPTTYIKSFSHDSDSSDHTQTSLDTNTTVEYISSHALDLSDEEDAEVEEESVDIHFFPSHNTFKEPLEFGGKLTLDAVKIDCSDIFLNT